MVVKDVLIREPWGSDLRFIYATWLNSYRSDSAIGRSIKKSIFFGEYPRIIDEIFDNQETITRVAALREDPFVILGYIVCGPNFVHYCYVKEDFRRFGIAKYLLTTAFPREFNTEGRVRVPDLNRPPCYTHKTKMVAPILERHSEWIYNPFLLYSKSKQN